MTPQILSPHVSVDLSKPDNTEYVKGRSRLIWALWYFIGSPILASYWLPISSLKCAVLHLFGAKLGINVYIKPRVRVKFPWFLSIGDNSWIGEDVWIDNLAPVEICANVCVSQGVYVCTGNHDWKSPNMKLVAKPVRVEDGAWVAARSTLCPGVTVGKAAILTVSSVAAKSIPPFQIWSGSPAVYVRDRTFHQTP